MTPVAFVDELEPWCIAGATGALRMLDPPGGTVYLVHGQISYAECPCVCGVNRMLTASGRLSPEALRSAHAAGRTSGARTALTRPGLLSPMELEVMVLAAVYSAVYVTFDAHADVRFEMGAAHPLAGVIALDLGTARTEVDRRREALHEAWPHPIVDSSPVVPSRRLDGHHVALTALQWEIAVNAGRRSRTPFDLARLLGRDTYATLLAVRRMVGSGLIQVPAAGSATAAITIDVKPALPQRPARASRAAKPAARAEPTGRGRNGTARPAPGTLPRREASGDNRPRPTIPDGDQDWSEMDLTRIRDALQAMR